MSKRNKAIFAGTSNTIGLGLELEFSKRFQDDKYLKNCKNIPPVDEGNSSFESYTEEDKQNQRKYRWPKLVCDYFNLEEINLNDPLTDYPEILLNQVRQAVDMVYSISEYEQNEEIKTLLSETKYIFLEFGYIRWWDDELHGVNTDFKWPSTPSEIDRFLKDKDVSFDKKQKAIDWLNNVNPIELWERTILRIETLINKFPDIEFVLLCWGMNPDMFNLEITKKLEKYFLNIPVNSKDSKVKYDIGNYLDNNNFTIKDSVRAYNPKYKDKWLYEDYHANSEGHRIITNQIIKKLQNETRGMYTI